MVPLQAMPLMDQVWFAAAKSCSVHSSTCSLHNTQQWRKSTARLLHQKCKGGHADGSSGEKVISFRTRLQRRRTCLPWELLDLCCQVPTPGHPFL